MEVWKDVVGYEGKYLVSSYGQIKSLISNKVLKHGLCLAGYKQVNLYDLKGSHKPKLIHRLVAEAFIGVERLYVNHKDLNKLNNRLENLEYVTNRENSYHYHKSTGNTRIGINKIQNMHSVKYQVRLRFNGLKKCFGRYDTIEEALMARDKAIKEQEKIKYYKLKIKELK